MNKEKLKDLSIRYGSTRQLSDGNQGMNKNVGITTDLRNLVNPIPHRHTSGSMSGGSFGVSDAYYDNPYTKKLGGDNNQ